MVLLPVGTTFPVEHLGQGAEGDSLDHLGPVNEFVGPLGAGEPRVEDLDGAVEEHHHVTVSGRRGRRAVEVLGPLPRLAAGHDIEVPHVLAQPMGEQRTAAGDHVFSDGQVQGQELLHERMCAELHRAS
ncbi:putative AraC family transcriptional regulator [Streptomyces sp. Tu6071]|nr:putative AraC family transcriptional regulator [Streptomyces sp. Tu6071]